MATANLTGHEAEKRETPEDLLSAHGYVHAQDRFCRIELWRQIGPGRRSERFGEATWVTTWSSFSGMSLSGPCGRSQCAPSLRCRLVVRSLHKSPKLVPRHLVLANEELVEVYLLLRPLIVEGHFLYVGAAPGE